MLRHPTPKRSLVAACDRLPAVIAEATRPSRRKAGVVSGRDRRAAEQRDEVAALCMT